MKPTKIVNIVSLLLMPILSIYVIVNGILRVSSINVLLFKRLFSFIFPTIIFFLFWTISYKRQNEKLSIGKYYLNVVLNVVIPYLICITPYIIYKYGMNNLESDILAKLLITGNISKQFIFIKTIINLLIVFPLIEWLVKSKTKIAIILSFILSAISNLFQINYYFVSDVLNYLVYIIIGIFFARNGKEITLFLRKSNKKILSQLIGITILIFITTEFEIYRGLNSVVTILYNILIILIISYIGYRNKPYMAKFKFLIRNYIVKLIMINPSLIITTIFLLSNIIFILLKNFINKILTIYNLNLIYFLTLIVFLLILLVVKNTSQIYFVRHANEFRERKD